MALFLSLFYSIPPPPRPRPAATRGPWHRAREGRLRSLFVSRRPAFLGMNFLYQALAASGAAGASSPTWRALACCCCSPSESRSAPRRVGAPRNDLDPEPPRPVGSTEVGTAAVGPSTEGYAQSLPAAARAPLANDPLPGGGEWTTPRWPFSPEGEGRLGGGAPSEPGGPTTRFVLPRSSRGQCRACRNHFPAFPTVEGADRLIFCPPPTAPQYCAVFPSLAQKAARSLFGGMDPQRNSERGKEECF